MRLIEWKRTVTVGANSLSLVGAVTALVILPVFLVDLPAMNDYPGHLARMYILASIGTPEQNPYYYFYLPFVYPNLAMDIMVPILARFVDVASATKIFLILSQILMISGAAALEISLKRRHEFAGFVGTAVLYSLPFAWGFLNFEFGVGLALWGLASWFSFQYKDGVIRLVVHGLFCASLFVCHLAAFALYGATLIFCELWRAYQPTMDWKRRAHTFAILTGPAVIILLYFFHFTLNADKGIDGVAEEPHSWNAIAEFVSILHGLNGYSAYLSSAYLVAIIVSIYFLFKEGCLSITPQGKWVLIGFAILIVALPFRLLGGDLPGLRILIGALLILPAFLALQPKNPQLHYVPTAVFCLIALVNAGHTAKLWLTFEPEYATLSASFKQIHRGALVLVGHANFSGDRFDKAELPIMSATALATYYASAFVPTLVNIPGQQPLRVCPELGRFILERTADYWPVAFSVLEAVARGGSIFNAPQYVRDWVHDYDYLYLVGPRGPNPMPDRLTRLAASSRFALYRIEKSPGEGNALSKTVHHSNAAEPAGCLQLPKAVAKSSLKSAVPFAKGVPQG